MQSFFFLFLFLPTHSLRVSFPLSDITCHWNYVFCRFTSNEKQSVALERRNAIHTHTHNMHYQGYHQSRMAWNSIPTKTFSRRVVFVFFFSVSLFLFLYVFLAYFCFNRNSYFLAPKMLFSLYKFVVASELQSMNMNS